LNLKSNRRFLAEFILLEAEEFVDSKEKEKANEIIFFASGL
jgi:hypothetical protein